jgi:transposase-like protein
MNLPPEEEDCLFRLRSSTQKGGTLICEEVTDLTEHEKRIYSPDGYRPKPCRHCGRRLHVHDYRERSQRTEFGKQPPITIVRYRCEPCGVSWQILPLFLARYLRRTWDVVERTLMPEPSVREPEAKAREPQRKMAKRTVRRWQQRWLRPALLLAQVLAVAGQAWSGLATGLPVDALCADLVAAYGRERDADQPMAELAALFYRLQPNIRLL